MLKLEDWLDEENVRNHQHADFYTRLLNIAYGAVDDITIGHHLVSKKGNFVQEVPSADALLFNPKIMGAIFGDEAPEVMAQCARTPVAQREVLVAMLLEEYTRGTYHAAIGV